MESQEPIDSPRTAHDVRTTDQDVRTVDHDVRTVDPDVRTTDNVRTVGPREGLGAGIIALGVLAVTLPAVVDQLPSVAGGGSAAFVLYGMSVLIGIFVIIAGVMTFFVKD